MPSAVPASTATRMNPAWLIDENASMRFTSVCTTARIEPTSIVATASAYTYGCQSVLYASNATTNTRSSPANAAALTADAMKATTGVGDPWYTSGVHEWNGTAAILNPKPTSSSPKPARSNGGVPAVSRLGTTSPGVAPTEVVKPTMCERLVEPVEPYTSAMP